MDETMSPTPESSNEAEQVIDWEEPAETLEEANDRIRRLHDAVMRLTELTDHNRDFVRRDVDETLHPQRIEHYQSYDHDPTRAEGL